MTLFHDRMHKKIKVYADDLIAKSQGEVDHIVNLKKLFERLGKLQLKLNTKSPRSRQCLENYWGLWSVKRELR